MGEYSLQPRYYSLFSKSFSLLLDNDGSYRVNLQLEVRGNPGRLNRRNVGSNHFHFWMFICKVASALVSALC